jgi:hypothetical protein
LQLRVVVEQNVLILAARSFAVWRCGAAGNLAKSGASLLLSIFAVLLIQLSLCVWLATLRTGFVVKDPESRHAFYQSGHSEPQIDDKSYPFGSDVSPQEESLHMGLI